MQFWIYKLITLFTLGMISLHCSCASPELADTGIDIPYPRTPGIIPLAVNSSWLFAHSSYDSLGNIVSEDQSLHLNIDRVYGYENDSTLTLITELNVLEKFPLYIYEYEWEFLSKGLLISYRDQNVDTNGIYIHGEYVGEDKTLYRKPLLWLKYPASPGESWLLFSADTSDTMPSLYEVIDTSAEFYVPSQQQGLSALDFLSCYLYKETKGDTVSFYYYNDQFGSVGFLRYIKGILRRSYILRSFDS